MSEEPRNWNPSVGQVKLEPFPFLTPEPLEVQGLHAGTSTGDSRHFRDFIRSINVSKIVSGQRVSFHEEGGIAERNRTDTA